MRCCATSQIAGIMYDQNLDEDIRSLRQLVIYGLKGISAYGHQARELGYYSDTVDDFYIQGLAAVTDDQLTVEELIQLAMKTGTMALEIMQKLDEANTTVYGNPSPHAVPMTLKAGPFIIVSGHDFHDLEMLLAQSQGYRCQYLYPRRNAAGAWLRGVEKISASGGKLRWCMAGAAEAVRQYSGLHSNDDKLSDETAGQL